MTINERYVKKYGLGYATIKRFGLKLALFVYDRANRKCEICGNENNLTIHHKNNKGINLEHAGHKELVDNSLDNLIVLCRKCHGSIHGKQGKGILHRKGGGRKGAGENGTFARKGHEKEYNRNYYLKHKENYARRN